MHYYGSLDHVRHRHVSTAFCSLLLSSATAATAITRSPALRLTPSRMYGRLTSSLANLVSYNVFGAEGGSSTM